MPSRRTSAAVEEQARGPAERLSKAERPDLTEEELDEIIRLVEVEGQRIATVAKAFGVTRQALYMRQRRDESFADAITRARAKYEMALVRKFDAAVEEESKTWTGLAWRLERSCKPDPADPEDTGWLSAEAVAKIRALQETPAEAAEPDPRFE